MVGLFINTLPVRVSVDPQAKLVPWLKKLRAQQLALRPYEHTPLTKIQGWSDVPRGTPLFESILVFENNSLDAQLRALGGGWLNRRIQYRGQTNFPLTVIAYGDDEFLLQIEYSRRRFADAVVARMLFHLRTLLEGMAADPQARLSELPLLSAAEREQAIAEWNNAMSYPRGACLHQRFEEQVVRTPDAVALVYEDQRVSYAELNRRANGLALQLGELGVKPGQLVGLRTERSAEMVVGIVGILKSGGAYLPLDPAYPKDRVSFMIEDSRVAVVVTQKALAADLDGIAVTRVLLDEPVPGADTNPVPVATADDLAYVIYTSGSTGKPKGALVTHYNVTRLFEATDAWYQFGKDDVWTMFHSYAFDFSVWELWGALLYGGRVVIVPYWVSRSPEAFRELLVRERVSVLNQTPSAFRQLIQAELSEPKVDLALRYVIFGGEALELQSLRPWFERYGDERPLLVNMYGITETTVHVTYRPIRWEDVRSGQGSVIGIPIPDLQLYILDPTGQPTPIGVPGEMYVGGAGVARGYLNRAELTAQRFIPDRFVAASGARLYRTGDLARRLENGDIEYLGRIDHQVKIRGYRIELGEIEAGIARHPAIREVAVVAREEAPGDKRLIAYVVAESPPGDLLDQLRALIRTTMPEYMIPAHFVTLDALPLTENGKVDRKALPAPVVSRAGVAQSYAAPRTPTETSIAAIWGAVLGIDRVGIHDHFFELGGDSILSIQVIARCRQAGLSLSARDLFKRPTVAQLAEACAQSPAEVAVVPEVLAGNVLLTPVECWFTEQDISERHHWNQAFVFELPADANVPMLEQALQHVVRRHDAFRLRLRSAASGWVQEYGPHVPAEIERIDIAKEPSEQRAAAIAMHAARFQASLNISKGPLLCAAHFSLGGLERGRFLLIIHHIAVDGVSWRLIIEEIESVYLSLKEGRRPSLGAQTTSYRTWAARLAEYARSEALRRSLSFWVGESGKPVVALPSERGDCSNLEGDARSVKSCLTSEETRALLQQVPSAYRTQINDVLITALVRALQQWTEGETFRIDMEGHGREDLFEDVDVSRTVGWFTTIFPVRLGLPTGLAEGQALQSVKEQLRRIPDRGMSYGLLRYVCEDAQVRDALSRSPRSNLLFNYLGQFDQVVAGSNLFSFAGESAGPWHSPLARRTHWLEVLCMVREGRLEMEWVYNPEIHRDQTVDKLAQDFLAALRATIAHCLSAGGRTPSDFPLARLDQAAIDRLWQRHPDFEDLYPLTPMQRLFHAMESAHSNIGFEQWHLRIDGKVDADLLHSAVARVVQRHPILRTAFVSAIGEEPLQLVLRQVSLPWTVEDWRTLAPSEQRARLESLMEVDQHAGFDLAHAPLMRVALRRVADDSYHLVWSTHHLCIDGWSWPLVFREVSTLYEAMRQGSEPELSPPCTYRNYVQWLREEAPDSETFWKEELAGFETPTPLNLSEQPPAREAQPGRFAEHSASLDQETTTALLALARSQHVTLSTVVQGAWAILLSHYSDAPSIVLGAAFSGRPAEVPGIESLIGPCVNNLPVRVTVTPGELLLPWLSSLQQRQFMLAEHQYASLEQIQKWSRVPWRYRLFDSLMVFQNYRVDEAALRLGTDARLVPLVAPEATNYPLTIAVTPHSELRFRLIYQADRFTGDVVRTYAADLLVLLRTISQLPGIALAELISRLPASTRGKAAALAAVKAPLSRVSYSAPATATELSVASVWQELFGVERVSLDDNFFDLGGHSLLLMQAHARLRGTLWPELPVVALLQYPTIRSLARYLSGTVEPALAPVAVAERAQKQRQAMLKQKSIAGKR
jgi:amino acid adenylation domain-containing protein/non-ribosomal peptide synthase protein (TIGR01720 family)